MTLCVLVLLCGCAAAYSAGSEAEYIIKYKHSAKRSPEDGLPFEVVTEREMRRLRSEGLLEWYEPDAEGVLMEDYCESYQWNLDVVRAQEVFAAGTLGQGVRVGVIDSGIAPHEALDERVLPGCNYMDGASPQDTFDSYGHGTRVAGLIAGAGEHGYIGTAPGAKLIPLKITDGKSVKVSAICRAIYGGIDAYRCDVLNLSLGVTTDSQAFREAVEYAEAQGVVLIASSGNGGNRTAYYPASYESVVGVGMVDMNGSYVNRSNHNASVFLTAPGQDVRSTAANGGYTLSTGTSFSVPQVSGAAAVLLGIDASLTPYDVRDIFARSAQDKGLEGWDEYYGHGVLDLAAATASIEPPELPCVFLPEDGTATRLKNNTGEELRVTYLLATYDETGECQKVQTYDLTLAPYAIEDLFTPYDIVPTAQFACDPETMTPLAVERRS